MESMLRELSIVINKNPEYILCCKPECIRGLFIGNGGNRIYWKIWHGQSPLPPHIISLT